MSRGMERAVEGGVLMMPMRLVRRKEREGIIFVEKNAKGKKVCGC